MGQPVPAVKLIESESAEVKLDSLLQCNDNPVRLDINPNEMVNLKVTQNTRHLACDLSEPPNYLRLALVLIYEKRKINQ